MMIKKTIIISFLCFCACLSFAQAPIRTFTIDNNSRCRLYVYVTTARKVYVPRVVQTPYKVADIPSHSSAKIDFEYHPDWGDLTRLSFRFCTSTLRSCTSTVGEYTGFTIVPDPNSVDRWRLRADWLSIIWPYPVDDNIYRADGAKWGRSHGPF